MKDIATERTLNSLYRKKLHAKNKQERDSIREQIKIIKDAMEQIKIIKSARRGA